MLRDALFGTPAVLDLIELYFSRRASPDLRLALFDRDIVWAGANYIGAGLQTPLKTRQSITDSLGELTIVIPNVDRALVGVIAVTDVAGTPVLIRRVLQSRLTTGESMEFYRGKIKAPVICEGATVVFTVVPRAADPEGLLQVPGRANGIACPVRFGGPWCRKDLSGLTYAGTVGVGGNEGLIIDPGVTQDILDSIATFRGVDSDGQDIISPLPAFVELTSGNGAGSGRSIAALDPCRITLRKPFYQAMSEGDTYSLIRDCPKTIDACVGFDNVDNHHGNAYSPRQPRNLMRTLLT